MISIKLNQITLKTTHFSAKECKFGLSVG